MDRLAVAIAGEHRPDVVASSGPPHMAHEAGRRLAMRLGTPLLLDLRDPWFAEHAEPDDLRGRVWRRRTAAYELGACHAASCIVVNTPAAERMMRERYPELADRFRVIMNGADREVRQFAGRAARFELLYAGNLYGGRNPRVLFEGVRRFLERERPADGDVRVTFIGDTSYEGESLVDLAAHARIRDVFDGIPHLVRPDVLRRMGEAAVLVILPQQFSASVPAKVFEYMQFNAWILVMGQAGDAMTELMEGAGADVVPHTDPEAVARMLATRYREWKGGHRPAALNADGRFDRRVHADHMAVALEALAAPPASETSSR